MRKLFYVTLLSILCISITGCFKKDDLENITIYTTSYPIEYISNYLYGEHSKIYSIYPDGTDIEKYELNDKQINDYSKGNLYIFNGLGHEEAYVSKMFKKNKN